MYSLRSRTRDETAITQNRVIEILDDISEHEVCVVEKERASLSPRRRIVAQKNGIPVSEHDLATLKNRRWLNDIIVNVYLYMIAEKEPLRIATFDSYLFVKLFNNDLHTVLGWVDKILTRGFFNYERIMIPIHRNSHWTLVVIHPGVKEVNYYDSLHRKPSLSAIQKHIQPFLNSFGASGGWKWFIPRNAEKQSNSDDCGVFVCKFARGVVDAFFDGKEIDSIREHMAQEILGGKLFV